MSRDAAGARAAFSVAQAIWEKCPSIFDKAREEMPVKASERVPWATNSTASSPARMSCSQLFQALMLKDESSCYDQSGPEAV